MQIKMLVELMIARPADRSAWLLAAVCSLFAFTACEKVPLLAPSGSQIILTASTNSLPANGSTDIVAQVLEAAGTPPHSGTLVTFTTSLGVIEPSEAKTDIGGRVVVRFRANGANGNATIIASSGGASTGTAGGVKISVGTAAVGSVRINANPTVISANGGISTITANVVDINGNALAGVPVSFATSAGSLGSSLINTDSSGVALTTLTTSVQATVTATVGVQGSTGTGTGGTGGTGSTSGQASASTTVNVNPLPTVQIAAQGGTLTANSPIVFTITVSAGTGSTAQIKNVNVNFGDGEAQDLGAINGTTTVQHRYDEDDTYTVRLTVTDTLGGSTSAATVIVVQPRNPTVTITSSRTDGGFVWDYTFTANVSPSSTTVVSYVWNFGDGTTTGGGQTVTHSYQKGTGTRTVSVTITTENGQQASSSITITN
jgi:adhesin/invasin